MLFKKGVIKTFFEQMIFDSDTLLILDTTGYLMEYAFTWLKKNGGINYEL